MKNTQLIRVTLTFIIVWGAMAKADSIDNASGPQIWEVSSWAVPEDRPVSDMENCVAQAAAQYQRVTIVGDGTMADSLTNLLESRIGRERVSRTDALNSAEKFTSFAGAEQADLLIHVTDTPPEASMPSEKFVIQSKDVLELQDTILAGLHVIRTAEGTLKDPRTVADPIRQKTLQSLQNAFGDWSTSDAKGILERWDKTADMADKALKGFNLLSAGIHDFRAINQGKWTLANSQFLNQAIHLLADPGVGMLLKQLKTLKPADAMALPGALGYGELADGITKQIHDGHFTIDALQSYMDASVRANWFVVGLLLSGDNVRVAKYVSDLAIGTADFARSATEKPIDSIYDRFLDTGNVQAAFDQWQVEQISSARRDKPLVSWNDWATQNGINPDALDPAMNNIAQQLLGNCQRLLVATLKADHVKDATTPVPSGILGNNPGGVDMRMSISDAQRQNSKSNSTTQPDDAEKNRPNRDSLTWPASQH